MPIMFNSLLHSENIKIEDVRLLRHKDNRSAKGRSIYELWRDDRRSFEQYQKIQSFGNQVKLNCKYWASFIGTPQGETMFVGLYLVHNRKVLANDTPMPHKDGVDEAGSHDEYELSLEPELNDLIGRLFIEWGLGDRAWIQRADHQNKMVIELRTKFKEPDFPGYLYFMNSLSKLSSLPRSWVSTLEASKGIYILTCPKTKEQYVGSATGINGFWGRWQNYINDGHGGNVALKIRDLSDYQVSILEVAGSSCTVDDILEMEIRWKNKLQSREMGLNRN